MLSVSLEMVLSVVFIISLTIHKEDPYVFLLREVNQYIYVLQGVISPILQSELIPFLKKLTISSPLRDPFPFSRSSSMPFPSRR